MIRNIVVVCTGNLYRSPIAEALLQAALPECEVRSAGLHAALGMLAPTLLKKMFAARGLARLHWAPWQIGSSDVARADLLLVMETAQKRELERRFPSAAGKTFLFGAAVGGDIDDPHGDAQVLEHCFEQIEQCVPEWVQRIEALNGVRA
jgi:protein-tyrosine phosphatase